MHLYAQITWVLQCFHFRPDCFQPRFGKNDLFLLLLFILLLPRLLLPSCQPSVDFHKGVRLFYARARSRLTVHSKTVCGDAQALSVNFAEEKGEAEEGGGAGAGEETVPAPFPVQCACTFFFLFFFCLYANIDHLASFNIHSVQAASSP